MSTINGNASNNVLTGTSGDDNIDGGAGNDTIDGAGNGTYGDEISFSGATTGVTVNLTTGMANDGQGGTDVVSNIEHINATRFNDKLTGSSATNWFRPGAGDDTVDGMGGKDVVMYEDATAGVTVNLLTGVATGTSIGTDSLTSIEAVHGSFYDDRITLSNSDDYAFGRSGNDSITGGSGNNPISPGSGSDTIDGGGGEDEVDFNDDGYDNYTSIGRGTLGATANLETGVATDAWGFTDSLTSIERLKGTSLADLFIGNSKDNMLEGRSGNDTLKGGGGFDALKGGDGTDRADFSGNKSQYSLTKLSSTTYLISDLRANAPDGTDMLDSIEQLRFADQDTDLSWATVISTSGVKLEINTPMNKFVPQDKPNFDDFTGNTQTKYLKVAAFDASTGAYTLQVVRDYGPNPNYQANGVGMYGQPYLYGAFEVKGFVSPSTAPFPVAVGQELTNFSTFDTWLKSSVGVTVKTMKSIAYGSWDGVNSNGTQYDMVTRTFDNMDIKLLAYDLPESSQMSGNDTLLGNSGTDVLYGYEGNDSIDGKAGNDTLYGGAGNDSLVGGEGNDTLYGEQGNDTIDGGNGWDQAVFSGNLSDYIVAFNPSLQTVTLTDNRTGNAANSGTDVLKNIDNFQFANTSKTLLGLITAAGQNYGVDLNGLNDGGLQRTYWMGPSQYYPDSSNVLQKQAGAGFWGAEVGLSGGVKAVRISSAQSASSIQSNAVMDWVFGNVGSQTANPTLRFGETSASTASFTSNSKTFTASQTTHVTNGVTLYDLLIKASDNSLVDSEAMSNAMSQVRLDYRSSVTQPAQDQFDVKLQVNISADLQTWVGASTGQTDTYVARMDNQGPLIAAASYGGRMVGLAFKTILDIPTSLPDASLDAWQAHPDKSHFKVTVDGKQAIVMDAVMMNDGVALLLGSAIPSTARDVMVSYTDPKDNQSTKVIEDWQGNDTPSFSIKAVHNDATDFVGTISPNAVLGFMTDGDSLSKYVGNDGQFNEYALGKVTGVNGTSATISLVAPAWGINPGYSYKAGATQDVTQFAYTKERFDFTVVNPNGNTYAVGSTVQLPDLISFTKGASITRLTQYVVASHSNTATDGTNFEMAVFNINVPFPAWGIVTGFHLGEGNFTINGGPGDDTISVHGPNGMAIGGAGNDTYWYTPIGNGEKYTIDDASGTSDALSAQLFDGFDMIPRGERIGNDLQFVGSASNMASANSTLYIKNQYTTGTIETLNLIDPKGVVQRSYAFSISDTGSDAANLMVGTSQANLLSGGAGDDMMFGAGGNDTLNGDNGDDLLYGGAGTNLLQGGLGNDGYQWDITQGGNDSISDSGGYDYVMMRLPSLMLNAERSGNDVLVSMVSNGGTQSSVRLVNQLSTGKVEYFNFVLSTSDWQFAFDSTNAGTTSGDWMVGTSSAEALNGLAGDDWLTGGGGNDTLTGGTGNDILMGGSGTDSLVGGAGNDKYLVTDSSDVISELTSDNTASQMTFSMGNDNDVVIATVSYTLGAGVAVEDMLAAGSITADFWSESAINLTGNELAQGMVGNNANNMLHGMGGNDILLGNAGDDTLYGGDGNDCLMGGIDNDNLSGGAGDDWAIAFWGAVNGTGMTGLVGSLVSTGGFDSADGGSGSDTVVVNGLQSQFKVSRLATDDYLITSLSDSTESLRFTGFENISFGFISTSASGLTQANQVVVNLPGSYPINPSPITPVKDETPPTLLRQSPSANASNVATNSNVNLTFSESIQAGSGNVVLKKNGTTDRTIDISDNQVIINGSTLTLDPSTDLTGGATYTLEMASGVVKDMAGNAYAGLSNYSFSTQANAVAPTSAFVSLGNLKLTKDSVNNTSNVSFSVQLSSAQLDNLKITGLVIDLDYESSLVSNARVTSAKYDNAGDATAVWQFITPNLSGASASGKIAVIADNASSNPILVSGKTMDVTMVLNQAVDSFKIGFNGQVAHVVTSDNLDHVVGTGADATIAASSTFALKTQTNHWKALSNSSTGKALSDVSLAVGSITAKSDSAGSASLSSLPNVQSTMTAIKSISSDAEKAAAAQAVGLTDAISILKMIVGLSVNSGSTALSPYQVVAADFNRDGSVGLTDAIDVLKAVVGLTAPSPTWTFMDASKVASNLTMDSYNNDKTKSLDNGWMSPNMPLNLNTTTDVKLVGVLSGDVDGSWASA